MKLLGIEYYKSIDDVSQYRSFKVGKKLLWCKYEEIAEEKEVIPLKEKIKRFVIGLPV